MSGYACATNRSSTPFFGRCTNEAFGVLAPIFSCNRFFSKRAESCVCRRVLLVHRGSVRESPGRRERGFRIYRREGEQPELRAGVLGHDRPHGGRGGHVRPGQGELREAARRLL